MIALFEELAARGTELEITGKTPFFSTNPETLWWFRREVNVYVAGALRRVQTADVTSSPRRRRDGPFGVDADSTLRRRAAWPGDSRRGSCASRAPNSL
jgi:hypothetical protein